MSKCGRNELKTRQYDSVKCPARAVFAKSRARHVHVMSLNFLKVVKAHWFNYSISRVSYVHSSRASFRKLKRFRSLSIYANADFDFQLVF